MKIIDDIIEIFELNKLFSDRSIQNLIWISKINSKFNIKSKINIIDFYNLRLNQLTY